MKPVSGSQPRDPTLDVEAESAQSTSGPQKTSGTGKTAGPNGPEQRASGNSVEQYREGSTSGSGSTAPPDAPPGETVSAQQLALTSGSAAKNRAAEEKAYENIEHALTRRWDDPFISDADVRGVQEELQKLPPDSHRRVLEKMDRSGLLERFVDKLPEESKPRFLEQAVDKGYLTQDPGKKAAPAPHAPPDVPGLLKDDRRLPEAMRGLVFESNVRAANDYYAAHREYLGRYEAAAMGAKSVDDLRTLGEPVAAMSVQSGIDAGDADGRALQQAWARQVRGKDERAGAYKAVGDRVRDLAGEQRTGTTWLDLAAEISIEREGFSMKRGFEAQVTQYGTVRSGESASFGAHSEEFGNQIKTKSDGSFETEVIGRSGPVEVSESMSVDPDGKIKTTRGGSYSVPGRTIGLSLSDDGALEAELGIGIGPTAYSKVDPNKGTLEGGVNFDKEIEIFGTKLKMKAKAGAGYQGSPRGNAEAIARGNGAFEPPKETPKK